MEQEVDDDAQRMGGDGMEQEAVDAVLNELPEQDARSCMGCYAACRVLIMLG